MRISLIGSGNVATHMGAALKNAGHRIVQIWSRNDENAALAAYYLDAEAIGDLESLHQETDLVIIAVKDDAILHVASALQLKPDTLVVHTSGATDIQCLNRFDSFGAFYPLQTFSKNRTLNFFDVPMCIEGNNQASLQILLDLARTISNNVQEVDSERRKALHLSAVFACNFPNFLYHAAAEILNQHELDFNLLRPLIAETALKVQDNHPAQVQTGPAIRKDTQTMLKHYELLKDQPELQNIYRLLSQLIVKMDESKSVH
jgi:predicted short-subunit dehydrogenase-like oxidoreductase (DUF2520 family)